MSEEKGHEDLFRRHLDASLSEEEREELERAVLEDDGLFQKLLAIEGELVDSYVRGELDEASAARLGALIERSPRLQAKAETTLAFETLLVELPASEPLALETPASETPIGRSRPRPTPGERPRGSWWLLLAGAVTLFALLFWGFFAIAGLRTEIEALNERNEELRELSEELRRDVLRLEESNRALDRRIKEIVAGTSGEAR